MKQVNLSVRTRKVAFKKRDVILRPHDRSANVFCIMSGIVRAYSVNAEGSKIVHIIYRTGDFFPLAWGLMERI